MMFDPYRKWLGIPEDQRPPSHYQLLGIAPDEQDPEVIEAAAVRQSAFVRNFQSGKYGTDATRLLTEIAAARLCLLDPAKRSRYDAELKQQRSAPRRSAGRGPEPELGLAPLDDDPARQRATAPATAPAPAPPAERPAPRQPASSSQSSARYRDLAPRATPTPRASPTPPTRSAPPPRSAPAHRTPPASVPPAVELGDLLPQRPVSRAARTARLGPPRPASYSKPRSPIGLIWQIPLVIVVFIGLVLAANAVGRKIAASRPAASPASAVSPGS